MNTETHTPKPHAHVKIVRQVVTPVIQKPVQRDTFHHVSNVIATKLGSPVAFMAAVLLIVVWASSGPIFDYSNTWQLVINTTTTIVTFLMVFAIQNTQNRDSRAMQLKLDELLNSNKGARTEFVDIEDLSDVELDSLHAQFKDIHDKLQSVRDAK